MGLEEEEGSPRSQTYSPKGSGLFYILTVELDRGQLRLAT